MQIGNIIIEPWNRKNTIWRLLALSVIAAWVIWGVVIFKESKEIEARITAQRQEETRRQAINRRKATLEQDVQTEHSATSQNIIDALPGGKL